MSTPDAVKSIEQLASTFADEAADLLLELEATLLELEESPGDADLVGRVFRALHTIKGSSAMFGFNDVARFTHALEEAFDEVRNGRLPVTGGLVSMALVGKDQIRSMLAGDAESGRVERERLLGALREIVVKSPAEPVAAPVAVPASAPLETPARVVRTFEVSFKPGPDLLRDGTNPLGLWAELLGLGEGSVVASTDDVPTLEEIDPERCYVSWTATVSTTQDEAALRDVFMFVEDRGELRIELIEESAALAPPPAPVPEPAPAEAPLTPATPEPASERRPVAASRARRAEGAETGSSLRVAAEKLDCLVDLVGELVIAQARLSQVAARCEDAELTSIAEDVERLAAELRDNTLNVRMVTIGSTFGRFKRLVRDLSAELHKEIELVTDGAETELDKTVIERLGDPLVHLIRNCCDHGIEAPEVRIAAGKPKAGTVRLAAYQSGSSVVLEIQDDGAGLDAEAIRKKAVERGLLDPAVRLAEGDLFQLIFLPGFSTAATVSTVSGRGVGMDVVKRAVDALRGTVSIESRHGAGTTIRIKLPLTLAIIDGLLVSVGDGRYVLPMSLVEECVEITRESVEAGHGNHLVPVRGELVPYLRLREWFGERGDRPAVEQVAIASADGMRFGFAVDDVIGQHQTVIKTLGKMYCDTEGLSGATILGDGTVALIVDVAGVIRTLTTATSPAA